MSREVRIGINVEEYGTIYVDSISESYINLSLETEEETLSFALTSDESQDLVDSINEVKNFIRDNN